MHHSFSSKCIEIRLLSLTRPEHFFSYFDYHFPLIFKYIPKEVYFSKNLNHYRDRTGCMRVCSVKQVLIILTSARLADKYRCKTRVIINSQINEILLYTWLKIFTLLFTFYFLLFSVALYHELAEPSTYISSKNLTAFLQDLSQVRKTTRHVHVQCQQKRLGLDFGFNNVNWSTCILNLIKCVSFEQLPDLLQEGAIFGGDVTATVNSCINMVYIIKCTL